MIYCGKIANHVRVGKTKHSIKVTEKCQFWLHIALMRESNQWVLMTSKGKLKNTCDIYQGCIKLDMDRLHTGLALLSEDETKLAKNCSQLNINLSVTTEFLNICNYLGIINT